MLIFEQFVGRGLCSTPCARCSSSTARGVGKFPAIRKAKMEEFRWRGVVGDE